MSVPLIIGSVVLPLAMVGLWLAARAGERDAKRDLAPLAQLADDAERLARGESR